MLVNKRLAALLPLLTLGAAPATSDPVRSLTGRYSATFPNAMVDGEKYTSENIVEIVPVSGDAAYVRVHTEWFNGHGCALWGIAAAEGNRLVYRDPDPATISGSGQCILSVRRVGSRLRLNDEDRDGCYIRYCGMRGSFQNIDLPRAIAFQI